MPDRDRPAPARDRQRDEHRPSGHRDRSIRPAERPAERPVGRAKVRPRTTVRGPSVKVPMEVARLVRAGHPWVLRHTVRRDLDTLAEGIVVPVLDADGYGIGWGLVEAEGAIGVRMLSLDPDLTWTETEMLACAR